MKKIETNILCLVALSLPLLVSCGNNPSDPGVYYNVNLVMDGKTVTEKVKDNEYYRLPSKNTLELMNFGWKNGNVIYAANESIKVNGDITLEALSVKFNCIELPSLEDVNQNKTKLSFNSYLTQSSYQTYSSWLKKVGYIAIPSTEITDKEFTYENYKNNEKLIHSERDIPTFSGILKDTCSIEINNTDSSVQYVYKPYLSLNRDNDEFQVYPSFMSTYNKLSIINASKLLLKNGIKGESLVKNANSQLNINFYKSEIQYVDDVECLAASKVVKEVSGTINNGRIILKVTVDKTNFSTQLNKTFKDVICNGKQLKSDEFTQTYNETTGVVTVRFEAPNTTSYLVDNFYDGDRIYDESILLIAETDASGKVISAPKAKLLFEPKEIERVIWYYHNDRAKLQDPSITFVEGTDFKFENGYIVALGNIKPNGTFDTKLPYVLDKQLTGEINSWPGMSSPNQIRNKDHSEWFIPFTENNEIVQVQLSVTYTHVENSWFGKKQEYLGDSSMKNVVEKLKKQEDINMFVMGASNSTGANTSGYLKINPYLDTWMDLFRYNLEMYYKVTVNYDNRASGGTSAIDALNGGMGWINHGQQIIQPTLKAQLGMETFDPTALIQQYPSAMYIGTPLSFTPDITLCEYGINDPSRYDAKTYKNYMEQIIKILKAKNPNMCILFFTGMEVNQISANHTWEEENYKYLEELCSQYSNCAVMHLCNMVKDITADGKNYTSLASNNINHFNDFITRVTASMYLDALIKR